MKIVFTRVWQSIARDAFQLVQRDQILLNKKEDVFEICVKSAIQLAESNTVWICNLDLQVSKLTDVYTAFCTSRRQWNKAI